MASDASVRQSRWRITDARGRRVIQLDPIVLYLARDHRTIDADVLSSIAREKGIRIAGSERSSLIIGVLGVLLGIVLIAQSLIAGDFGDAAVARTCSLVMFSWFAWMYWIRAKRTRYGAIAEVMLRHRRCPHCGYDLHCLPADPSDGATVCPECGCAWLIPDGSAP